MFRKYYQMESWNQLSWLLGCHGNQPVQDFQEIISILVLSFLISHVDTQGG